jgi:hypothetical protein
MMEKVSQSESHSAAECVYTLMESELSISTPSQRRRHRKWKEGSELVGSFISQTKLAKALTMMNF